MEQCTLVRCNVWFSELQNCDVTGCDFTSSRLDSCKVKEAEFQRGGIKNSQVNQSKLTKASLENCILHETTFLRSSFQNCTFVRCSHHQTTSGFQPSRKRDVTPKTRVPKYEDARRRRSTTSRNSSATAISHTPLKGANAEPLGTKRSLPMTHGTPEPESAMKDVREDWGYTVQVDDLSEVPDSDDLIDLDFDLDGVTSPSHTSTSTYKRLRLL